MTDVSGKPPSDDDSGIRHPIRAAEHELEHLRDVANEGKSATTPAIVAGGMLAFLIPLFAARADARTRLAYSRRAAAEPSDTAAGGHLSSRAGKDGGMPPFKGSLTDQQIKDAAAYVTAKVAK